MTHNNHHNPLFEHTDIETLAILDQDHPGAHDPAYRERREEIAQLARDFRTDPTGEIPLAPYTPEEDMLWRDVNEHLSELHSAHACSAYINARQKMNIPLGKIPQLREISKTLTTFEHFRLAPIEGLVDTRTFLSMLEHGVMLCTQYIRHTSKPKFTPEPDIIHELVGHAPMFVDPHIVQFSKYIGYAAKRATDEQLEQLGRLYWWTIEYGMVEEKGTPKAFGAGMLGGIEDMTRAVSGEAQHRPFILEEVINTDFNYSFVQPTFFVAPSFEFLEQETKRFIETEILR